MKPKKSTKREPRQNREPSTTRRLTPTDGVTLTLVRVRGWASLRPIARVLLRTPLLPGDPPSLLTWRRVGSKESSEHAAWLVAGSAPHRQVLSILALAGVGYREESSASQVRLTHGAVLTDPSGTGRREEVDARGMPLWTVSLGVTRVFPPMPSQMSLDGTEERAEPVVRVIPPSAEPGRMAGLIPHAQPELGAWVLGCDGAPALLAEAIEPRYEVHWQARDTYGQWKKRSAGTLLEARADFACALAERMFEGFKTRVVEANTGAVFCEASYGRDPAGCLVKRVAHHSVASTDSKRERIVVEGDAVVAGIDHGTVAKVDGDRVTIEVAHGAAEGRHVLIADAFKWKRLTGLPKGEVRGAWFVAFKAVKAAREAAASVMSAAAPAKPTRARKGAAR